MAKGDDLTELEGAVLTEIHHHGNHTAFAVARAFQRSMSAEWSGSAGAIYPAITRLTKRGLIMRSEARTGRKTRDLSLSQAGIDALAVWSCDAERAVGLGLDPFRLRAGLWRRLPAVRRDAQLEAVRTALRARLAELEVRAGEFDDLEQTAIQLAISLERLRLRWLDEAFAS